MPRMKAWSLLSSSQKLLILLMSDLPILLSLVRYKIICAAKELQVWSNTA